MASSAFPDQARSLWMDGSADLGAPALDTDVEVDVCVVGGGITGTSAALALQESGARVALLEADRVGAGVTGHTTAKLTSLHELIYDELQRTFGAGRTRAYAAANEAAIGEVARRVEQLSIDCAFRRRDAYTYVTDAGNVSELENEVAAGRDAGLALELVRETPLPYPVAAAVRLAGQAELQPRSYVLALARAFTAAGGQLFERTRVTALHERGGPSVETEGGRRVRAGHVLVATLMPLFDRGMWFTRLTPKRSYCIAARGAASVPDGMFISADEPTRSIRAHPDPAGDGELLIVGGEGHNTGEEGDTTDERYRRLAAFAAEAFGATEVTHRWSAHDLMPADGLPYAGRLTPFSGKVLFAAGFRKWGLTNGVATAGVLADRVLGRENPSAELYDAQRFTPLRSAKGVTKELAKDTRHMVGDRLKRADGDSLDDLAPGDGKLLRLKDGLVAAHRTEAGDVHAVSPVCTHLGCRVAWNVAERSWDCPCHGSRFAPDGSVLQGPAVRPLERKSGD